VRAIHERGHANLETDLPASASRQVSAVFCPWLNLLRQAAVVVALRDSPILRFLFSPGRLLGRTYFGKSQFCQPTVESRNGVHSGLCPGSPIFNDEEYFTAEVAGDRKAEGIAFGNLCDLCGKTHGNLVEEICAARKEVER
jgi:hypothetical protein